MSNKAVEFETNVDLSWWSDVTTKIDPAQIIITNYSDWILNLYNISSILN